MSHTLTLCVFALGDECVSLSIYALFRLEHFQEFSFKSVLMPAVRMSWLENVEADIGRTRDRQGNYPCHNIPMIIIMIQIGH